MPAQSTMVPAAAGSESAWNFLDDTYWIVPTPYLPAVILVNSGTPALVPVVDQTVWHITAVVAGYVFGEVQTNVGNGWVHSTLVGSITPAGQVSFSFTPDNPAGDITVGHGTMQQINGDWFFEMQMTSGTGFASITHWASMAQVDAADEAWTSLPGFANTSVPAVFDTDPANDGDVTLKIAVGTDGGERLVAPRSTGGLILGEGGDDTLIGNRTQGDALLGGAGNDVLNGCGGDDELYGESGNDRLVGADGDDMLDGGAGADRLIGGAGADKFVFAMAGDSAPNARDTIVDFSQGDGDRIDLSPLDADPSVDGNNGFAFIGVAAFSGTEGEVRAEIRNGNTFVSADLNGDAVADVSVRLLGAHNLTADDFVL
jgi:Ca2+-binding RTX toxin-like protein